MGNETLAETVSLKTQTTHPILDQYENISLKSFIKRQSLRIWGHEGVHSQRGNRDEVTEEHDSTAGIPQGTYQVPELTKLNPKFSGEVDVYQGGNRAALLNKEGGTEKQISAQLILNDLR